MTEQRWPDRIWIVRHGESAGNVARDAAYAAGHAVIDIAERDVDVPLSARGEEQSTALGQWFAALAPEQRPNVLLTSPYLRARQTGALIERAGGLAADAPEAADERLREKEFGILDRLTKVGIEQRFPDQAALRARIGKFYFRPPGGESWCDVILRLRSVLDTISLHHSERGSRVLVVAHQVIVLCARYLIEDLGEDEILAIDREGDVANCGVTEYDLDRSAAPGGRLRLRTYNFVAPLEEAGGARDDDAGRARGRQVTRRSRRAISVTRALLHRIPLPQPDAEGDKDERGRVLVVGGSAQVAGAVLLAGVAALRTGAGKLQLATVASAAQALGMAVPEALVVALPQTRAGEIAGARAHSLLAQHVEQTNAMLVGPGMSSARSAHALVAPLVRRLGPEATLILDAAAILALRDDATMLVPLEGRAVITPHAGEMASLLDIDKRDVEADPAAIALDAAARFATVVALKGAETWIAEPEGTLYHFRGGSIGLATSGSGDTLAGIVAGLAARGASAARATVWAAYLHGAAGQALSKRVGPIGYLARELLAELPPLLRRLR